MTDIESVTAEIRQGKKTRKPRNGAVVITASMHGFANCRSKAPWTWPWPSIESRSHQHTQYV